jgi:S-DNA-T family DNA segregation ATPase FtsK/SpoIIIE
MARDSAARQDREDRVVPIDKKRRPREERDDRRFMSGEKQREAFGFVLVAAAIVLFLSLILNPSELRGITTSETPSAAGRFGRWIASQIGILFGFGGLVIPFTIGGWGWAIFHESPKRTIFAKGLALTVALIATCASLGLSYEGGYLGGALGDRLAHDLYQTFGLVSWIVVLFAGIVAIVIGTPLSFSSVGAAGLQGLAIVWRHAIALEQRLADRILHHRGDSAERGETDAPTPVEKSKIQEEKPRDRKKVSAENTVVVESAPDAAAESDASGRDYFDKAETRVVSTPALKILKGRSTEADVSPIAPDATVTPAIATPSSSIVGAADGPSASAPPRVEVNYTPDEDFTLPEITLLNDPLPVDESVTEEDLKIKALSLQATLSDFGVECKVGDIVPGPTVTRFEVIPAPGVRVSSITALSDDISLAMAAPSIRIEAPIPGKTAVGIEIPNRKGHKVTLKEVVMSEEFQRIRRVSPLAVALGQDIAGLPVVADLRKMPHLLIAGATGSGKSVCINSIVNSLLLSAKPTEVKMLMVDPKVVELQEYNDVPHLLAPVVTDARKAPHVLMWAVEEMERRYQYLAKAGVRDIESFNAIVAERVTAALTPEATEPEFDDFDDVKESGDEEEIEETSHTYESLSDPLPERLPYIVAIVDEFGDLMMVAAKECEDAIIRIAQMARAVGIHLIIATQRPSVDVITGVIKANLPSRISFQVSSKIDSRTILDVMGAERLLGMGDMLFKPGDKPKPIRLQGCFIGGKEIKDIIRHYSSQGRARRMLMLEADVNGGSGNGSLANDDDPLLEQAMRICLEDGMASVSRIQRRLKVGHPRAARIVDIMEAKGMVSPPDGSKPRKLHFDASYFERSGRDSGE